MRTGLTAPQLLEDVDRGRRRAAGREHRVEDQAQVDRRRVGQLVVVLDRPERPLVAEQARGARPGRSASARASRRPCRGRPAGSARARSARRARSPPSPRSASGSSAAGPGVGERLVAEEPATARGRPRGTSSARSPRRGGSRACGGPPGGCETCRVGGWATASSGGSGRPRPGRSARVDRTLRAGPGWRAARGRPTGGRPPLTPADDRPLASRRGRVCPVGWLVRVPTEWLLGRPSRPLGRRGPRQPSGPVAVSSPDRDAPPTCQPSAVPRPGARPRPAPTERRRPPVAGRRRPGPSRRSSSARSATGSRRASIAATSSRPTSTAG